MTCQMTACQSPLKSKAKGLDPQAKRLGRVKVRQFESLAHQCPIDNPFEPFFIFLISENDLSSVAYVHLQNEVENDYQRPNDIVLIAIDAETKLSYKFKGKPAKTPFCTGDVVQIPKGCGYKLTNIDSSRPAQLLAVFSPSISNLGHKSLFFERWGRAAEAAKQYQETLKPSNDPKTPIIPYKTFAMTEAPKPEKHSIVSHEISHTQSATVTAAAVYQSLKPHVHPNNDEVFLLLGGGGQFYHKSPTKGTASHKLQPGSIVHIPKGVGHAFKLTSGEKAIILAVHAPGLKPKSTQSQKWNPSQDPIKQALAPQKNTQVKPAHETKLQEN